ncbi:MAG: hypothetical protein WC549_07565 [Actinomycetota bacterium]
MSNTGHIVTSDKSIFSRYGKKHNPIEMEGMVKICPHCGRGKIYRQGRMWTPCPVCRNK